MCFSCFFFQYKSLGQASDVVDRYTRDNPLMKVTKSKQLSILRFLKGTDNV